MRNDKTMIDGDSRLPRIDGDSRLPRPDEIVYLDYTPPPYPWLSRLASVPGVSLAIDCLTADSSFRRHPRPRQYMSDLVEIHTAQSIDNVSGRDEPSRRRSRDARDCQGRWLVMAGR